MPLTSKAARAARLLLRLLQAVQLQPLKPPRHPRQMRLAAHRQPRAAVVALATDFSIHEGLHAD